MLLYVCVCVCQTVAPMPPPPPPPLLLLLSHNTGRVEIEEAAQCPGLSPPKKRGVHGNGRAENDDDEEGGGP